VSARGGESANEMAARCRVVIAEDDVLLREGIARLLTEAGFEVVAQAATADDLVRKALAHHPDLMIADINMPPGHGDDGLQAALDVRRRQPDIGVLILSQYYDEAYAAELLAEGADGVGYLLKERVGDVDSFVQAAGRVAAGRSALDPEVVARMVGRRRRDSPIAQLSPRELEVLAAMAEGKSNRGIAEALVVSQAAVEKHVTSIFHKLGLDPADTEHRRVLAVLAYLRNG
jgi:DNA-binding NarL/FixJ family response regulator